MHGRTATTTLGRRLGRQVALTVGGVAALVAITALGIAGLRQDYGDSLRANEQLRELYTVGASVAAAKTHLDGRSADLASAATELRRARDRFELLQQTRGDDEWLPETTTQAAAVRAALRDAVDAAATGTASAVEQAIGRCYSSIASLSTAVRQALTHRQQAADAKHRTVLTAVTAAGLITAAGVLAIGLRQYRAVTRPVRAMQQATRDFADGQLSSRVPETGDAEFVALGRDFNRMAGELEGLYRNLHEQIEAKGRELARSERLASIGSLAAGVAHEINNPIAIIAGYAERSLGRLGDDGGNPAVKRSLEIIRDEAFRCRRITDGLLMLSRTAAPDRQPVDVARLTREVIESVDTAHPGAGGRVTIEAGDESCVVNASTSELRQVLLNLLVNAAEATAETRSAVRVSVRNIRDAVELAVEDDGVGMTPDTLAKVFEPFFTTKRGGDRPGTGLGLAIAHAIVRDHGGTLDAHSDGVGKGSRFVVRLPAAATEASHA